MPQFQISSAPMRTLEPPALNPDGTFKAPAVLTPTRNQSITDTNTVRYVLERVADSTRADRPYKDKALAHWCQESSIHPADWPFWTKYYEPETVSALRKFAQGVMTPIFEKDTLCRVKANDDQGEIERESTQICMDYVIREHLDAKMGWYYQFRETASFGNGVVRNLVECKPEIVGGIEPITVGNEYKIPVGYRRVEQQYEDYWPKMRNLSRFDIGPAATGGTIQEMPHFHERLIWTLDMAQTAGKRAGWRNTDQLKGFFAVDRVEGFALGNWDDRNWDLPARMRLVGYDVADGFTGPVGQGAVKYTEIIVYTEAPKDRRGGARIIIIGDGEWLLWDSDWPRAGYPKGGYPYWHGLKPYSEMKFWPRNAQLWQAKGLCDLMEDKQYQLNALLCTAGDMISEQREPMKLVNKNAGVEDISELVREPGKILAVGNHEGIKDWIAPKTPDDVFKMIDQCRVELQKIGDNPDYSHGIGGQQTGLAPGNETLGGITQLLQEAGKSKSFIAQFCEPGLEDGLNQVLANLQQTMTRRQRLKIEGDYKALKKAGFVKWVEVDQGTIQGRWHVQVLGPSRAYDSLVRAQLIQHALETAQKLPEVGPRIKQLYSWMLVMHLLGFEDAETCIMSDEEFEEKKRTVLPPTPQKVLESFKPDKMPPDAQAALLEKIGLPTKVGGSSPLEAHLAKGLTQSMGQQDKMQQLRTKVLADHAKNQLKAFRG